ncbi:DUF5790 family protein [Salinilacihabitans rarus]|uniref:DUF5790 family protein n=1 Tax=Salinilacihabitans rarus TaxID=2961596 RepID=UPI0020C915FD|nr:DUF5790 family protein [Salinilacihabitans rarus]
MSQASLDDDELFGEAASEMRADVEDSLERAWEALPAADDVWETDADNVLGTLNGLKSALDAGDAEAHLRDAKKWFTMGERAGAFEDAEDLEAEIADVEDAIADVATAGEQVSDLTATIPGLRNTLESAGPDEDASEDDADE